MRGLLWQLQSGGAVLHWSSDMRSPSVPTINLNGVGVIILGPSTPTHPPLPLLNPTFLPDTVSYKQSSQFPPLDIGKGDGLSWKKPEASQESFRTCCFSNARVGGCLLWGPWWTSSHEDVPPRDRMAEAHTGGVTVFDSSALTP